MTRKVVLVGLLLACLFASVQFYRYYRYRSIISIDDAIASEGIPSLIADEFGIDRSGLRVLHLRVLPTDPTLVENWHNVTNVILLWMQSPAGKFNVKVFYDEMKSDTNFNGGAWYSSRSLFNGEVVYAAKLGNSGDVQQMTRLRIDALSLRLKGFKYRGARGKQSDLNF